jgi:hypothetical protein
LLLPMKVVFLHAVKQLCRFETYSLPVLPAPTQ